ncbi:MAG: sensor histidine kinase [Haloarculaceae archaeon]
MIRRVLAVGSIALSGLGLVAGGAASVAGAGDSASAVLGALGVLLGLALAGGAVFLYRSEVRTSHALRVAGWNLLGLVVLGAVLAVATVAAGVALPLFVVVDVLGVSSVAHVLIGYNDVRRIRAEELARQRRTLAVVNRVVRHNLRNDSQVLTGQAGRLASEVDDPDLEAAAETVREKAFDLADVHEDLQAFQAALDDGAPTQSVGLADVVEAVVDDYRSDHPGVTFEVDVPPDLTVRADAQLTTALDHLVENAVEHGTDPTADAVPAPSAEPTPDAEPADGVVRVSATADGDRASVSVEDDGPGLPDDEVAVLTDEREISQLDHASGLGLWVARAIAERYGGDMTFEQPGTGSRVTLSLPAV